MYFQRCYNFFQRYFIEYLPVKIAKEHKMDFNKQAQLLGKLYSGEMTHLELIELGELESKQFNYQVYNLDWSRHPHRDINWLFNDD